MIDWTQMNQSLYEGNAPLVKQMTEQALAEGFPPETVLEEGLIASMSVVGEDFKYNRLYVPQVLVAARAMKAGMAVLKPLLSGKEGQREVGALMMGTVKGDLHDIGKNLVCMMAEGAGLRVIDLGVDVSLDVFKAKAREHKPQIVGMSALLTTTMPYMKKVIDAFAEEDDLQHIKMAVGGAPVSVMYADEVGADGYAADASTAVEIFLKLIEEAKQPASPL
ncbi:MAG: methyltransferase [Verrucomicrobia bacterium RIFCSPLOWO2_12_FULL_64_8]|nr:MAG: methyltransferase [Verrucomicrobia bacterium RIFCSPLOWO2_12_FULL_64_8]